MLGAGVARGAQDGGDFVVVEGGDDGAVVGSDEGTGVVDTEARVRSGEIGGVQIGIGVDVEGVKESSGVDGGAASADG